MTPPVTPQRGPGAGSGGAPRTPALRRPANINVANTWQKKQQDIRERHLEYLDDKWNGRQNWAQPPFIVQVEALGNNITSALKSVTRSSLQLGKPLSDLWKPGGFLHDAVASSARKRRSGHGNRVTQFNVAEAREMAHKACKDAEQREALVWQRRLDDDSRESEPDPPLANRGTSEDSFASLNTVLHLSARDKKRRGESASPTANVKRCKTNATQLLEDEHGIEYYDLTQPSPAQTPKPESNTLAIRLPSDATTTALCSAKRQLQSPRKWLSTDVVDVLLREILQRADNNTIGVVSGYWLQPDMALDKMHPRDHLPGHVTKCDTVYMPLHTQNPAHWSLAVVHYDSQRNARIDYYDSMTDKDRAERVSRALRKAVASPQQVVHFASVPCPQHVDLYNCGVFVVSVVDNLLRGQGIPDELDLVDERAKWLASLDRYALPDSQGMEPDSAGQMEPVDTGHDDLEPAHVGERLVEAKARLRWLERVRDGLEKRQEVVSVWKDMERPIAKLSDLMNYTDMWNDEEERTRHMKCLGLLDSAKDMFSSDTLQGYSKSQIKHEVKLKQSEVNHLAQLNKRDKIKRADEKLEKKKEAKRKRLLEIQQAEDEERQAEEEARRAREETTSGDI